MQAGYININKQQLHIYLWQQPCCCEPTQKLPQLSTPCSACALAGACHTLQCSIIHHTCYSVASYTTHAQWSKHLSQAVPHEVHLNKLYSLCCTYAAQRCCAVASQCIIQGEEAPFATWLDILEVPVTGPALLSPPAAALSIGAGTASFEATRISAVASSLVLAGAIPAASVLAGDGMSAAAGFGSTATAPVGAAEAVACRDLTPAAAARDVALPLQLMKML
jgi:hypothetical protein